MGKTKLPKRIAGVKIPKKVRKSGGSALEMLRHPLLADIVAAGLIAAAAALRDNKKVRSAARTAKGKAGDAAQDLGAGAASLGAVIAAKAREGADWLGENYAGMAASANGSGSGAGRGGKSAKSSGTKPSRGKKTKKKG